jgi:hypothetical protein
MHRFRVLAMSAIAAGVLALGLGATSASAAQTNLKIPPGTAIDVSFPESVSCPGGVTGDVVIVVKSGHQNALPNGHINATIVGDGYIVAGVTDPNDPFGTGTTVAGPGHAEAWFTFNPGAAAGAGNGATVSTDTVNAQIGGFTIKGPGTFVVDANGNIRVNRSSLTCS